MTTATQPLLRDNASLYDFQTEGLARVYFDTAEESEHDAILCIWDTGTGKTHLSTFLACLLLEDQSVDQVIIACEHGTLDDWEKVFATSTHLVTHRYHGSGRAKRLAKTADSRVLISTYETLKADLVHREKPPGKRRKTALSDGTLMQAMNLRGKRVLWVLDELTRCKNRSSQISKAFSHVLSELRAGDHHQRVLGLSATPLERDIEDAFNIGRILCPELMPSVTQFERRYTKGVDMYKRYIIRSDRKAEFLNLFSPVTIVKHKTDPDVIAQFPAMTEESIQFPLEKSHRDFVDAVAEMTADDEAAFTLLRMSVDHPAAHLHAGNDVSRAIVETLGEHELRAIPSTKSKELIARLTPLVKGQGSQAIVFTYFGQTVLPELARDLRSAGFSVATFTGGMSAAEQEAAKRSFTEGDAEVFLSSDAGAKGLNLGTASYVFEAESSLSYAGHTQRVNRASRLSSVVPTVTVYTMIALDTIEEALVEIMLRRNEDHDVLAGGDEENGYVSAADRRVALNRARKG